MISVEKLTKHFPGKIEAVKGISFHVEQGEVYGLLGPNGAGKTTTLRMILGLLQPTSGDARVSNFRSTEEPDEVKRRVGLVSASAGLYQWLSPREVLSFFGDLYAVPPDLVTERIATLAHLLQFEQFQNRRCSTLSTGQKQRVNLARALIHDPPVMLLDEPTRGLDVVGRQTIFNYIDHLHDQNKAVIICTHQLDEAQRLCDRFGLLHEGELRHEGTLHELQESTGCLDLVDMFLKLLPESETAFPAKAAGL
jgi:sodium transport system ATP-binding protein